MKDRTPRYKSQSVNYLGFLAKQLGDLRGPSSLAYELIQNADDAKDDSLKLSATRIVFNIRDDALVVSNDAVFREEDFDRISDIASGTKKQEGGDHTTGAFGVGFISVYQVTDRPEILSAHQRWIFRPEEQESKRIEIQDGLVTKGTEFRLPWATNKTELRAKLQAPPITKEYIQTLADELNVSLPKAILFLKKLEYIELIDKGKSTKIRRVNEPNGFVIYCDDERQEYWRILSGKISPAEEKYTHNDNRSGLVKVAVPDKFSGNGILFATLPTKGSTELPFHINADFFPDSSRKSIMFEDKHDPKSEWNREALQVAASVVKDNLIVIRDMFINNPIDFWAMLERLYNINGKIKKTKKDRKIKPDDPIPLELFWDLFWEELKPILETHPIVYTESNQWLRPVEVRIPPASNKGWKAIDAFESLGIEIVYRGLGKKFRRVLTSNGVRPLGIKDIYDAFAVNGLIGNPQSISLFYQNYDRLELMWQGIFFTVYDRIKSKTLQEDDKDMLSECVLAPGIDGRIWPCDSVYLGEDDLTYELFSHLLPEDRSFLDRNISYPIINEDKEEEEGPGSSLLRHLCPTFLPGEAIESLEALDPEELENRIDQEGFRPEDIIYWFSERQSKMDGFYMKQLALLPIFPTSEGSLTTLEDLWMPGDFSDPIGIAKILDMERLKGLSDFLRELGAEELTFSDYASRYITTAFGIESSVDHKTKLQLLEMLEEYIDQIREDEQLQYELAETSIVECEDGSFRTPKEVYLRNTEVTEVLGDFVNYCTLPKSAKGRRDLYRRRNLYRWLGVASHPRTNDIIRVVDELTDESPDHHRTRESIISCLKSAAKYLESFSDYEREFLKGHKWLPAIGSFDRWYSPEELFTYENKRLFESQASFLDVPDRIQEKLGSVLEDLGIESVPQPSQVVKHLLKCSQEDIEPAPNVYDWLTEWLEDIPDRDLRLLQDSACLYMGSQYHRPDQIFWRHDFGGFRFQLDQKMRYYSELLQAVGVKEEPDHDDALKLLKEISKEMGNNRLESKDKVAVLQCWVILSRALDQEDIDATTIRDELRNTKCVPNDQEVLYRPSLLFFEDRPRLKGLFELFKNRNSCIQRTEGIYRGMEAAGVRLLSSAIFARVYKEEDTNFSEEQGIRDKILERRRLITTILEGFSNYNVHTTDNGSVSIDDIRFFSTNELRVNWKLEAFNRIECSESAESAHFDREEKVIYFQGGAKNPPWLAIARELSYALARGGSVASISPGLKVVLEAHDYEDACRQLEDLGIALTEELARPLQPSESVAFDDAPADDALTETKVMGGVDDDEGDHIYVEPDKQDQDQDVPYGQRLYEYRKASPRRAPEHSVRLPHAGSKTRKSASEHTKISAQKRRSGDDLVVVDGDEGDHIYVEPDKQDQDQDVPYGQRLYEYRKASPRRAPEHSVRLPHAGSKTRKSASEHTKISAQRGRSGMHITRSNTIWEPTEAFEALAREFRDMVHGDYGKRCQMCGTTFSTSAGDLQVYVVHVLPPSENDLTNHYGNLLGLCGWHYSLIRYNQDREFFDSSTEQPFKGWEHMLKYVIDTNDPDIDEEGNSYFGLGIRFHNIYRQWSSEPTTESVVIRYCEPHWTYLQELLPQARRR